MGKQQLQVEGVTQTEARRTNLKAGANIVLTPNGSDVQIDVVGLAAAWSPLDASPVLWLDASTLTLADNDPVASWTDLSGNGNHATESTNKPTFKTNIVNSLPVVRFDGTNDKLLCATNLGFAADPAFSMFVVAKTGDNFATISPLVNIRDFCWLGWNYFNGNTNFVYRDFGTHGFSNPKAATNAFHAYGLVHNPGTGDTATANSVRLYEDGVLKALASSSGGTDIATNDGVVAIGHNNNSYYANADIAEVVLFDRPVSESVIAKMHDYLSAKYGIDP